jgi:hypothetical protein
VGLDRARASDSRFGPRRAVQHLVRSANCGEEPRVSPDVDFRLIYSSIIATIDNNVTNPSAAAYLQNISRRTLLHALRHARVDLAAAQRAGLHTGVTGFCEAFVCRFALCRPAGRREVNSAIGRTSAFSR